MAEVKISTKADVIALLARHLREHYGDRLIYLFALKDDPYEPQQECCALYLVAILRNEDFDPFEENRVVTEVSEQINEALDYTYVATVYVASEDDYRRRLTGSVVAAQEDGVAL